MKRAKYFADRPRLAWRRQGFVLPTVLVLLVVMSALVVFAVRRALVDDRVAGALRDSVETLGAADSALRYCELWVWASPPGVAPRAGFADPPATVAAPAAGATAAWRVADNWTSSSVTVPGSEIGSNISATCLIEDARNELTSVSDVQYKKLGQEANYVGSSQVNADDGWRKYRITAVATNQPGGFGAKRTARVQSELRVNIK